MIRWLTAGESHGRDLTVILDGVPAGIELTTQTIAEHLRRRRLGYGRGARQKFEQDKVLITAGVRHGVTMGSPVCITIHNTEWPKWETVMSPDPVDSDLLAVHSDPNAPRELGRNKPLTRPRPGHADAAGMTKYHLQEARPILERASARETAARTAAGVVARQFLSQAAGVTVHSHTVALGDVRVSELEGYPTREQLDAVDEDPVRCVDPDRSAAMVAAVDAARVAGDTLGGMVEVIAEQVPPGLGSHTQWDRKLDARLGGAMMSIQAIKAVELGRGYEISGVPGSQAHDQIHVPPGGSAHRPTLWAGGVEGGISMGGRLALRAAMKPISTVPQPLQTIDVATGEAATAHHQRSDICAVPAAGVIAEAMMALVLADALVEKCGGDHVSETARNLQTYLEAIPAGLRVH